MSAALCDRALVFRLFGKQKGGLFGGNFLGVFECCGLVGFELEEGIAAVLNDEFDAVRLAVEGVARDGGSLQRGVGVKTTGAGQFSFFFGFLAHGGLRGDGDGGGGTAFVFAQAEGEDEVANVFAIDGQSTWEIAVGGGQPAVEGVGK